MNNLGSFPNVRPRRLRGLKSIRSLVQETYLNPDKLVLPLFIKHGVQIKNPIKSMPGHFQLSIDQLDEEIKTIQSLGINSVLLFGIPEFKDPLAKDSYSDNGIIQTAIRTIKKLAPNILIITDNCFCEYTDHGHCGILDPNCYDDSPTTDNDKSLDLLALQAISYAKAGADIIAPSCNIDGMVQKIRIALDRSDFKHIPILSYAVKYASAMYGPFRQAAEGAPKIGNRASYQMDYANSFEAIRESSLDVAEGADFLMVKPAHTYLDIIYRVKEAFPYLPLGAYHTSGEFAMLKAAAEKGWIDEKKAVFEVLTAIHRSGADFIITYYAKELAGWMK